MTPAMKYRTTLPFAPEFDVRRSEIAVFKDWESEEFVVTVHPKLSVDERRSDVLDVYYAAAEEKAKSLWQEKYGRSMPEHVEFQWAETCFADAIPHEGVVQLTPEEVAFLQTAKSFGDFTLDMLWLLVEGLGWRPGKPVSEDDPGWLAVWAEDEKCGSYYEIFRAALAMPEPNYIGYRAEMPTSVRAAYAS